MVSSEPLFPIVGIGASAGGVQAFEGLFQAMPANCGLAFVVVTHLSPRHESLLHEIIGRCASTPVVVAENDMVVQPDVIYVMPANAVLTIAEGRLKLRRLDGEQRERHPIDLFFAALARDRGDRAVGIILSGGGADGTLGVKAIKEGGGLTLAQTADGSAPLHPDMPRSAIAAGMVDHACPVEDMPLKLLTFKGSAALAQGIDDTPRIRRAVYDVLRKQTGHDFSGYKTNTFQRRVGRRMQILQIDEAQAYVDRLATDHDEVVQLFRDLLINVTNFFRDLDAFHGLETMIVPSLFKGRGADETIRVWVPGCSTGEEVYSIGMLLREHMDKLKVMPRAQIFATDIDEPALAVARAARYPEALLEAVSPERRRRFFQRDGGTYVVSKDVRDLCIFSPHSVIKDPPFSRIDLVSCRNLLIYFGPDIQKQVIPIFHYSLRPSGYLFLGTSENVGPFSDLFAPVDKSQRIFQARDHGATERLPAALYGLRAPPSTPGGAQVSKSTPLRHLVEARVVEKFAPAHVVVNGEGDVVYASQGTGRYLELPQGPPTRQLVAMARKGLRLDLRGALHEIATTRRTIVRDNVVIDEDGETIQMVRLTVDPMPDRESGEALVLVLFEDKSPVAAPDGLSSAERAPPEGLVASLERDLRDTRERLQSMIEEYETALEDLKSSNEELVSVNEELQSTNEEMEASKEELQSLNEELQTVNMELTGKLDDLDRANGDLKNLFESTEIATIFLDRHLVIRSFTPAVSRIFRLIQTDRGRPLTDLARHPSYPGLEAHIRAVLDTGEMAEHRIAEPLDGRRYLARLIPYRDKDERIDGVVVTFVDVSSVLMSEERQRLLLDALDHRLRTMFADAVSIARNMGGRGVSVETFRADLIARFHALSEAHELVSRAPEAEVALATIVARGLAPFDSSRVAALGPDVGVGAKMALPLRLAIHELAANASRHGALSRETGTIAVSWRETADGGLALEWIESGGPAVSGVGEPGFGLALIERAVKSGLLGDVVWDWRPEGLAIRIAFPRPNKE
jgi:two-component system CheB/CheR fusion protein